MQNVKQWNNVNILHLRWFLRWRNKTGHTEQVNKLIGRCKPEHVTTRNMFAQSSKEQLQTNRPKLCKKKTPQTRWYETKWSYCMTLKTNSEQKDKILSALEFNILCKLILMY